MFDEGLFARALTRPAHDASAAALDEIMHLAQSANYEPAAQRATELIEAGCKDVRAFIVYALGAFAEHGPGVVPALFDAIRAVLVRPASDSIPASSSSRTMDTALRFGFRIMKAQLDFDERQNEATRRVWARHLTADCAAAVLRACADLRKAIHEVVEAPLCELELGAVIARFEAYFSRNTPEAQPPPRVSGEPHERLEDVASPPLAPLSERTAAASRQALPSFARRVSDHEPETGSLAVSPALHHFIRKLEAFEQLVTNGSLGKAAIVADDIRNVIAAFDPMIYFPNLLAPHFRLLSHKIEDLSPYWEQGATPVRDALEQLYRVDLDAFVEA